MAKDESRKDRWVKASQRLHNAFQMAAVSCYMMVLFAQPAAAADTMWTRFSTIIADVYGELVGISTIVAVTAAAVALLVRMISRNERAVAEATSWLKRIVVTWIVLNTLGFVVAYPRRGTGHLRHPGGHLCGPVRRGVLYPPPGAVLPALGGRRAALSARPARTGAGAGGGPQRPRPSQGDRLGEAGDGEPL